MTTQRIIDSLENYTGELDSLNAFTTVVSEELGPDWTDKIYTVLADIPAPLKEKLDHAFNYYAAITAWDEIQSYLTQAEPLDYAQTLERIPVLEHWLAFFGAPGQEVVTQLQERLKREGQESAQNTALLDEPFAQPLIETSQPEVSHPETNTPVGTQSASQEEPHPVSNETSETVSIESVASSVVSPVQNDVNRYQRPSQVEVQSETSIDQKEMSDEHENNGPLSGDALQNRIHDIFSDDHTDQQNGISTDPFVPDFVNEPVMIEKTQEVKTQEAQTVDPIQQPVIQDVQFETIEAEPIKKESIEEMSMEEDAPQDIPLVRESEEEWKINKVFRQIDFEGQIQSWISGRSFELGYSNPYNYRYYGFLVDVMDKTIEEIKEVLADTKLYDLIERKKKGGVHYLQNQLIALEKQSKEAHESVASDLSPLPREDLSVDDLKKTLGQMDYSTEKEYAEPAPDGFEMVEDPYENMDEDTLKKEYEKIESEGNLQNEEVTVAPVSTVAQKAQTPKEKTSQTPKNGVQRKMSFSLGNKKPTGSGTTGV